MRAGDLGPLVAPSTYPASEASVTSRCRNSALANRGPVRQVKRAEGVEGMTLPKRRKILSLPIAVLVTLALGANAPMWAGSPEVAPLLSVSTEVNPLLSIEDSYGTFEGDALARGAIGFLHRCQDG